MGADYRVAVAFARYDENVPPELTDFAKPCGEISAVKQRKWYSRRVAFWLLQQLFQRYALDDTPLTAIQRTASGRPFIDLQGVDFNISHSGEWVAVMLSVGGNKKAVGIDIEHPKKVRRFADLIRYYANEEEQRAFLAVPPQAQERAFYLSWCLREAVLKAQGVGIVKLSAVRHLPHSQQIFTAHCPRGTLYFYDNMPFYFCCFFEQPKPQFELLALCGGKLQKSVQKPSLVYDVNPI